MVIWIYAPAGTGNEAWRENSNDHNFTSIHLVIYLLFNTQIATLIKNEKSNAEIANRFSNHKQLAQKYVWTKIVKKVHEKLLKASNPPFGAENLYFTYIYKLPILSI